MRNIISRFDSTKKYHDDYFDIEIKILEFPYKESFGDFRMFNGISLQEMDIILTEIIEPLNKLASLQEKNKASSLNRRRE